MSDLRDPPDEFDQMETDAMEAEYQASVTVDADAKLVRKALEHRPAYRSKRRLKVWTDPALAALDRLVARCEEAEKRHDQVQHLLELTLDRSEAAEAEAARLRRELEGTGHALANADRLAARYREVLEPMLALMEKYPELLGFPVAIERARAALEQGADVGA